MTDGKTSQGPQTYAGIPVETIALMYDYLKNCDGALYGGFAEGFVEGAKWAAAKINEDIQQSMERMILTGFGV